MKLPRPSLMQRIREMAPALALGSMLILPFVLRAEPYSSTEIRERHAEIAAAINSVPWSINSWTAVDVPVPGAVEDILRPNALISRRYRNLGEGGGDATVVIVHCSDVRDMDGHYPPICYPNAGFTRDRESEMLIEDRFGEHAVTLRAYQFVKSTGVGVEQRLYVYSFFVLPDGTVVTEMSDVRELVRRTATSALGVTQVQVVRMSGEGPARDMESIRELLGGMNDLFTVLRQPAERMQPEGGKE